MKRVGIGYTIFEWHGDTKVPIEMVKGRPGNLFNELAHIQKKAQKLADENKKLYELSTWVFLYGFTLRVALAI